MCRMKNAYLRVNAGKVFLFAWPTSPSPEKDDVAFMAGHTLTGAKGSKWPSGRSAETFDVTFCWVIVALSEETQHFRQWTWQEEQLQSAGGPVPPACSGALTFDFLLSGIKYGWVCSSSLSDESSCLFPYIILSNPTTNDTPQKTYFKYLDQRTLSNLVFDFSTSGQGLPPPPFFFFSW